MRRLRVRHATSTLCVVVLALGVGTPVASAHPSTVKSLVWAGYQADHDTFRSVAAAWTVPAITCTGTTGAGDPDSYFSVGLGSKPSATERVGVRELCTGSIPSYVAYLEMNGLYEVQAIDPAPGDAISASVAYRHGKYLFSLADSTLGLSFSLQYACGAFSAGQGACSRSTALVSAGIWQPRLSPLADYGAVAFGDIVVKDARGHRGAFAKNDHWGVTRLAEYDGRKVAASATSLHQGGTQFRDTWHRP